MNDKRQGVPDAAKICFGLNEELDRDSLAIFLQLSGSQDFAHLLAARLDRDEILPLVDSLMALIKKHLSEPEYHAIFLKDRGERQSSQITGDSRG